MDEVYLLRLNLVRHDNFLRCVFGRRPEREEVVQLVYDKREQCEQGELEEALEMARTGDYYVDVVPFYT